MAGNHCQKKTKQKHDLDSARGKCFKGNINFRMKWSQLSWSADSRHWLEESREEGVEQ